MKTLILIIILTSNAIIALGQNLISNWRFQEDFMVINCQDWFDGCGNELTISCDTTPYCQVRLYNQSASDIPDEIWSLQLDAGFPSEGLAETYITGQSGSKVYQLKYWMKSAPTLSNENSIGLVSIGTVIQNQFAVSKTISDTTSVWKQFTLIDSLTTQATDTIAVRLSAGNCDFCTNTVYFDFVELTVIDSFIPLVHIERYENGGIKVYPNPSKENLTIEINDSKNDKHLLTIYNSTGQLIKAIEATKNVLTFDHSNITSGLYFYQIQKSSNKKIIGQGKFIIE